MNINQAFPSEYVKSSDLSAGPALVTIDTVEIRTLGQGRDAETKPVVYFSSSSLPAILEKGLALNKTNANKIAELYGDETSEWKGKEIVLYETEVEFQGKVTPATRVRAPKQRTEPAKPKPKQEPVRELVDDEIPF